MMDRRVPSPHEVGRGAAVRGFLSLRNNPCKESINSMKIIYIFPLTAAPLPHYMGAMGPKGISHMHQESLPLISPFCRASVPAKNTTRYVNIC